MSALSAAASDEDGDIIKTLQARVADLEAQLYAVGAGGVGKLEQPQSVTNCHQSQPQGEHGPVAYYVMNGAALFQLFRSKSQADALAYDLQKRHDLSGSLAHFHVVPLYTHPQPPRQPLTEMEIVELRQLTPGTLDVQFVKFARSIKAAHGVKGRK